MRRKSSIKNNNNKQRIHASPLISGTTPSCFCCCDIFLILANKSTVSCKSSAVLSCCSRGRYDGEAFFSAVCQFLVLRRNKKKKKCSRSSLLCFLPPPPQAHTLFYYLGYRGSTSEQLHKHAHSHIYSPVLLIVRLNHHAAGGEGGPFGKRRTNNKRACRCTHCLNVGALFHFCPLYC
jgi:hypothetical protein